MWKLLIFFRNEKIYHYSSIYSRFMYTVQWAGSFLDVLVLLMLLLMMMMMRVPVIFSNSRSLVLEFVRMMFTVYRVCVCGVYVCILVVVVVVELDIFTSWGFFLILVALIMYYRNDLTETKYWEKKTTTTITETNSRIYPMDRRKQKYLVVCQMYSHASPIFERGGWKWGSDFCCCSCNSVSSSVCPFLLFIHSYIHPSIPLFVACVGILFFSFGSLKNILLFFGKAQNYKEWLKEKVNNR